MNYRVTRKRTAKAKDHPLRIEALEERLALSAASLGDAVGDATFVLYDGEACGTATVGYSRDIATVEDDGSSVAADVPLYETVSVSGELEWTSSGVSAYSSGTVSILASGWDSDGETPLLVVNATTASRVLIFKGYDFELVSSIHYTELGTMAGCTNSNYYHPSAAIVFNGLVVLACAWDQYDGEGYQTMGSAFIYTQDYGATLDFVSMVDGSTDVPAIADGGADGCTRGREWAFMNPFPVSDINDTNDVWFPWADYIQKSNNPKGGQIGLFRATRADESSPWIVQPNRVIFEQWIEEDSGGLHAHTAAVTTGGLISHWGDVGYRNSTMFHEFDLENYQTAPVVTSTVFGGYDATASEHLTAPQPVAAAPAAGQGEHLASGDLTRETVLHFSSLETSDDKLEIDAPLVLPLRERGGNLMKGLDEIHLHWLQGSGYVTGGASAAYWNYSPDGENWVSVRPPTGVGGRLWLFGDRIISVDSSRIFWTASQPEVVEVEALEIESGGTNLLPSTIQFAANPQSGVVVRELVYVEGEWRYSDTNECYDCELAVPPGEGPYYEITVNSTSKNLGQYWLQSEAESYSLAAGYHADLYIANVGKQSSEVIVGLVGANTVGRYNGIAQQIAETGDWVSYSGLTQSTSATTQRIALSLSLRYASPGTRFVVAPTYFGEGGVSQYPIASGETGSDVTAWVDFEALSPTWGVGIAFQWPNSAPLRNAPAMGVATLEGANGDSVTITATHSPLGTVDWTATLFKNGIEVASVVTSSDVLRSEIVQLFVAQSTEGLTLTVRSGTKVIAQQTAPLDEEIALDKVTRLTWGSSDGKSASINPILAVIESDQSIDAATARGWVGAGVYEMLTYFAEPMAGDFNSDGVVDLADFTLWRNTLGSEGIGLAADGNKNGVVDVADYVLWKENFGNRDKTLAEVLATPLEYDHGSVAEALAGMFGGDDSATVGESEQASSGDTQGVAAGEDVASGDASGSASEGAAAGRVAAATFTAPAVTGRGHHSPASRSAAATQGSSPLATALADIASQDRSLPAVKKSTEEIFARSQQIVQPNSSDLSDGASTSGTFDFAHWSGSVRRGLDL